MAVTAQRVSVGTTATALNTASTAGATLTIRNGATAIDLGPSTVTTGQGYSLAASAVVTVEVDGGDQLYAITGVGSSNVEVLRT
jgi:hypothetical protein